MKMYPLVFASIALLLLCGAASAQMKCFDNESYKLTDAGSTAYESLSKETLFALGGIGYSGETSSGEAAMKVLAKDPAGKMAFFKLSTNDAGAGGLYGLIGLKVLRSECFDEAYRTFTRLPNKGETKGRHETLAAGEVGFMSGCIYAVYNRAVLAKEIFDGKFDGRVRGIQSRM